MGMLAPGLVALNGGEWSKRLWGRYDQPKYMNALRRCENFIPLVHGPVIRRPGFRFVSWTRRNEADLRIVPFVYAQDQAYILEFSDDGSARKLRFYRNRSAVTEAGKAISAISKANPGVVTANAHGFSAGDEVFVSGVAGMTQVNGRRFRVGTTATNTFQLLDAITGAAIDTSGFTTYSAGGTAARIYEVTHPYAAADLPLLKWTQALDTMFLFCPGYAPRKLTRSGDAAWAFSTPTFEDGPYLPENATTTTLTLGALSGSGVSLTFSSTAGVNNGSGLSSADVGRLVRVLTKEDGDDTPPYVWAVLRIASVSSTTVGTADFVYTGQDEQTNTKREWRLGYWNDARGWPTCGVFHKGRLWLASSAAHPENVWGSEAENFLRFAPTPNAAFEDSIIPGPTATNAVTLVASDDQAALIRWLLPTRPMIAGCSAGEQSVKASSLDEAIGPDNATISPSSSVGAANTPPVRVDNVGLFLDRTQRRLYEVAYRLQDDNVAAVDLSLYAEHIGQGSPMKRIVWQRNPWRVIWACREDGQLVGCTYEREQEVVAWHRHPLGGLNAKVLDLAVIPGAGQDELWLVVEREINGEARRFLEHMVDDRWAASPTDRAQWCYADSALAYNGASVTALSGLDHLENETVTILADGAAHGSRIVINGAIALERASSTVQVGLGYSSVLETNNLEVGNPLGAAVGRPKTLHSLTALMFDSLGGRVGPAADRLEALLYRTPGGAMDAAPELFTGAKTVEWPGGWQREKRILFLQDQPLPLNLVGFVPQMQINEMMAG